MAWLGLREREREFFWCEEERAKRQSKGKGKLKNDKNDLINGAQMMLVFKDQISHFLKPLDVFSMISYLRVGYCNLPIILFSHCSQSLLSLSLSLSLSVMVDNVNIVFCLPSFWVPKIIVWLLKKEKVSLQTI